MTRKVLINVVVSWFLSLVILPLLEARMTSCDNLYTIPNVTQSLPCIEIPHCKISRSFVNIKKLSNGRGSSFSSYTIELCYDETYIEIKSFNQTYFPTNKRYQNCNDVIFYLDDGAVFVASWSIEEETASDGPHGYSELENVM